MVTPSGRYVQESGGPSWSPGSVPAATTLAGMTVSIAASGITRRFGDLTAVDAVDLGIAPGTLYGFLGRNGAGKTTLIRMLLGLIRPTAGEVSILGRVVDSRGGLPGPWADVGYLVDGPGLYPDLTARDHLHMAAAYRQVPRAACDEIVERLALGRYLDVRPRALSQGNGQRLALTLRYLPRVSRSMISSQAARGTSR